MAPRCVEMPARDRLPQPGAINLVVPRRRAEVPENRLIILWQQREAREFVHRPGADMRGRDVADVVHVKAKQRAEFRLFEQRLIRASR